MIHIIWSMPWSDASMVARAATAPSRDISMHPCPFASRNEMVTPVQKWEEPTSSAPNSTHLDHGHVLVQSYRHVHPKFTSERSMRSSTRPLPRHHVKILSELNQKLKTNTP
jgi:hypothetical protein